MEQLYVDDYLGGTDSIEAAKRRVEETNTLFKEAQINMRSYATNCEELRQFLEEKGLENQPLVSFRRHWIINKKFSGSGGILDPTYSSLNHHL
jgi:hypothetical protein